MLFIWSVLLATLQSQAPATDWRPPNHIALSLMLGEINRYCEEHARTEVFLQYNEPGYLDLSGVGCSTSCQNSLFEDEYEYIEFDTAVVPPRMMERMPTINLIDGPGKYRFSVQLAGHRDCASFEALRQSMRPQEVERRYGAYDGLCIAAEKVSSFRSRFAVDRISESNRDLVLAGDASFSASKRGVKITRRATGEAESRLVSVTFTPVPASLEGPADGLSTKARINCSSDVSPRNFIDHVLRGKELRGRR